MQNHVLASSVRTLFDEMDRATSEKPVTPLLVLNQVRMAFPQFAEQSRNGGYAQQDADEFYSQLMFALLNKLKDVNVSVGDKQIRTQDLFEGQFDQMYCFALNPLLSVS
jgi:ubiquitin carboxyl-terminal hydrolase 14